MAAGEDRHLNGIVASCQLLPMGIEHPVLPDLQIFPERLGIWIFRSILSVFKS